MGGEAEAKVEPVEERHLIGRGRELQRITVACQEAARGPGSLTLVSGGPGLGKSRLLEAAAAAARAEELPIVVARCWPDGGAPPLWPWQSIVRDLCGPEAPALLAEEEAGMEPTAMGDHRFASWAAITERLVAETAERPACLTIDDVHGADAASLSLLRFVVRALPRPRLAIIVSRRTGASPPGLREARLLDEIEAEAVPVVLQPFELAETARFLRAHGMACAVGAQSDGELDEDLLRAVVQVCCGNPAELQRLALGGTDLVDGVRRTVRRSLLELTDVHRRVLQVAAVLGTTSSVAEVAAVVGCDRGLVLAAISEAAGLGLVAANQPRVDFGHESVRAALECSMPSGERLDAHARAVSVVHQGGTHGSQGMGDDGPALPSPRAVRWAYHALAAAPRSTDDARTAIAACRAAGHAMTADLALGDADAFLTAAVELHAHETQTLGAPPAALLVEWGKAALQRGLLAEARQRFERAAGAVGQEDDPTCLAEIAVGLGGQWINEHRTPFERARILGLLRAARFRLCSRDDAEATALRRRLEVRLAAEAYCDGHPVEPVLAALDRVRALGDDRALAEALSLTHHALLAPEHAERRLRLVDELIRVAAGCDRALGLMGLCWRAVDLFLLGDGRARRALEALREEATALGNESMSYIVDVLDVMLLMRVGRLDEAEAAAQRAHHRGQVLGEVDAFNYLSIQLLVIRWLQDRHGELAEAIENMVGSVAVSPGEFAFQASGAAAAARAGRLDRARAVLAALTAHGLATLPRSSSWPTGMTSIIELAVLVDDADAAREAYALLAPYADRPVLPSLAVVCLGSAERWLGLASRVWGDGELACRHLERAVHANLAFDNRPMVAMTRAELAEVLLERRGPGDLHQATELLDLAIGAAESMDMSRRAATWRDLRREVAQDREAHRLPRTDTALLVAEAESDVRQGSVRRRGRGWLIALDERRVELPDLVGMSYVAELLRHPGRRISALALIGGSDVVPALQHGDHHDLLDDQARLAYGARLRELTAELEEAEDHADLGRADRLRIEIDALVEHLEEATGLAGRSRSFAHSPERARIAVRKAIIRAIDRIDDADAVAGTALRTVIATGTTCSYEPTADPTTTWTVDSAP